VLALEQMRDTDGEFDDLDTALDVTLGIGDRLAVLHGQQLGELVDVLVDQLDEPHHHPRPALRIPGGPFGLRLGGARDSGVDVGRRAQQNLSLHPPRARVHHVSGAGRLPAGAAAVDEVLDMNSHAVPRLESDGGDADY
jgi:hypothetical protein